MKSALFVAFAVALGLAAPALACSCAERTPGQSIAEAELIFIGTARETVHSDEEGSDTVYTVFKVKETLKGEPSEEAYISHELDTGSNCGIDFADGKEVLVLANHPSDDEPTTTDHCTMTGVTEATIRDALKAASGK